MVNLYRICGGDKDNAKAQTENLLFEEAEEAEFDERQTRTCKEKMA